jgi:aminoglycoside phosphotransferase (APT) family kinase protein
VTDVVDTFAEAERSTVPPLVVLEGLSPFVPGEGPIRVTRLGDGHSNETFRVDRDGSSWVLRRPPRPPFPPTAHDVLREHAIVDVLCQLGVPVPTPLCACADPGPIGAPFFLMEMLDGVTIREAPPDALDDSAGRRAIGEILVDALADLHAVEWRGTPLEQISRPDGYLDRQVRRWTSQWGHNRTRPVPAIDELGERLRRRVPTTPEATLVHGDYKLDNLLFARTAPARLLALVDWELATLGDPLADLGFLLATYVAPGENPDPVLGFSPATAGAGSLDREEIVARYAVRSGRRVDGLRWYECLALWKLVILLEGSYKRHRAGATSDPFFVLLGDGIPRLAERALALSDQL